MESRPVEQRFTLKTLHQGTTDYLVLLSQAKLYCSLVQYFLCKPLFHWSGFHFWLFHIRTQFISIEKQERLMHLNSFHATGLFLYPLKHQKTYKMVKHTQTICGLLLTNCLSVFDHFVSFLMFTGGIERDQRHEMD